MKLQYDYRDSLSVKAKMGVLYVLNIYGAPVCVCVCVKMAFFKNFVCYINYVTIYHI